MEHVRQSVTVMMCVLLIGMLRLNIPSIGVASNTLDSIQFVSAE